MGIRLALGAEPRSLVAMITRQALMPAVIGAAIGLFASGLVAVVVRSRFHGASPIEPLVFAGATTVMMVVLSVATILPASRAARINPVDTLRTE
jgi:ABC-type antimicrobial peptide transport system permease subunit